MQCQICGAEEESINHVLFECLPALQTWAITNIPSNPGIFPTPSVFTNMDYHFWRLPKGHDLNYFLWILWYIWKNRNDKIFKNKTGDPPDILRKAEIKSVLWTEAQMKEPSIRVFWELPGIKLYMAPIGVILTEHIILDCVFVLTLNFQDTLFQE